MKPIVKKRIAFFNPQGFIDGTNAPFIIDNFDYQYLLEQKPKAIFVSLKKVIFFNKKGLSYLTDIMNKAKDKLGCAIGFCDYDRKKYEAIISMYKEDVDFSLFEKGEVVNMFFSDKDGTADKKILIYNEDLDQKNQMMLELYEKGYRPETAKDDRDFEQKRKDYIDDVIIQNSYVGSFDKKIVANIQDNVIVYTLHHFVDSDVAKAFDLEYHENSLRVGFKLFLFNATNVSSMNIHGINFLAKIATAGAEYGATFCIAGINKKNLTEKLKNDLEDAGILVYGSLEEFFGDEEIKSEAGGGTVDAKKQKKINRAMIEKLPIFIEASIHTIEIMSQIEAKKDSVNMGTVSIDTEDELYSSSIGFYGDMDGIITLVFRKDLVKKACALLLGGFENTDEDIIDALGEFVNIIGGKIKSLLAENGVRIHITLPRTFIKSSDIKDFLKNKKGVLMQFSFDDEPFRFFLSR